jgi:hypothetical protein
LLEHRYYSSLLGNENTAKSSSLQNMKRWKMVVPTGVEPVS